MSVKKELVCINCPLGCRLSVVLENDKVKKISGNHCQRGLEYGHQEAVLPLRIFTGLMRTNADHPLSVRSDRPVPKSILLQCAAELRRHRPFEPVKTGTVILKNICGTECNILATRDL